MRVVRCTFSQTEYRIAEKIGVDRLPLGGNFIEVQGVVEGVDFRAIGRKRDVVVSARFFGPLDYA